MQILYINCVLLLKALHTFDNISYFVQQCIWHIKVVKCKLYISILTNLLSKYKTKMSVLKYLKWMFHFSRRHSLLNISDIPRAWLPYHSGSSPQFIVPCSNWPFLGKPVDLEEMGICIGSWWGNFELVAFLAMFFYIYFYVNSENHYYCLILSLLQN